MSEIKNKLGKIFGKKEDDAEISSKSENIAEYPDEIIEETAAPIDSSSESDDDVKVYGEDEQEETIDTAQIEHDAKNYFNKTHQNTIEDKIKSLRENALNTYAKDELEEVAEETKEYDVVANETADEKQSSHSYDMTQLLNLLKTDPSSVDDDDDEDEDKYSKKKKKKSEKNDFTEETDIVEEEIEEIYDNEYPHDFEYTSGVQSNDFFKSFRKSAIVSSISVILTLFFTALCIWLECGRGAGLPWENVMKPGYFGKVYAMISLQMLAFCVMFNLDGFVRGIRKLSVKKAAPESVAVISVAVCVIHTIITSVVAYNSASYRTFCYVGCIITLFLSLNSFVKAYTRFKSFTTILSKKPKLATVVNDALSEENGVFAKYLNEDSEVLTVTKAATFSNFSKNSYKIPKAVSPCNLLLYIVLALSFITFIVRFALLGGSFYDSVTDGVTVFMFSAPVSFLIVTALPFFITFSRVSKLRNSIIGEAGCDTIENVGVVSFDDTEVFPPKTVKVSSIKTYNENRIDKVIVCMAKIFDKLGGPLSYVFSSSVQGFAENSGDVMVVESSKDGLHLTVGEDDILVGNSNYLRMFDIEAPIDENDENEIRSLTSILYLVSNGQLAAKFYIKYMLNRKFESVLKAFYDAGICCGIRTCDPGVDNKLIEANLRGLNYPVSVVHKAIKESEESETSSVLVGLSGIHNYLRSFIMLDNLRSVYRTNSVLGILFAFIGLAISMILIFSGIEISAFMLCMFYIVWTVPQLLVSLLKK